MEGCIEKTNVSLRYSPKNLRILFENQQLRKDAQCSFRTWRHMKIHPPDHSPYCMWGAESQWESSTIPLLDGLEDHKMEISVIVQGINLQEQLLNIHQKGSLAEYHWW